MPEERRDPSTADDVPLHARVGNKLLEAAETVVYAGIALLLIAVALALLVGAAAKVPSMLTEGEVVAVELLDTLLLVFIVVELLFAVRVTIAKRELVAEPFLLVGVIASIKEIVVLSVEAADLVGKGAAFDDSITEIAVLGVLVLLLGVAAFLLRRKEREPGEGDDDPHHADEAEPATA